MKVEYKSKVYLDNVALQIMKRESANIALAGDLEPFYILEKRKIL